MDAPLEYVRPELFDEALDRHHRSYVSTVFWRSARHDTLPDDPHVDVDTPAMDSEVRNSHLLFISVSLQ
jgi:hypothetical protein